MPIIIILFLVGAALVGFGIWEQKTKYSDQQFAEAKVVAHQRRKLRAPSPKVSIMLAAAEAIEPTLIPVVRFNDVNGGMHTVPLHFQIGRTLLRKFPEFEVGGKVTVSFFGDSPKECFLEGHPMSQKIIKTSISLIIGIVLLVSAVLLTAYYISI